MEGMTTALPCVSKEGICNLVSSLSSFEGLDEHRDDLEQVAGDEEGGLILVCGDEALGIQRACLIAKDDVNGKINDNFAINEDGAGCCIFSLFDIFILYENRLTKCKSDFQNEKYRAATNVNNARKALKIQACPGIGRVRVAPRLL